MAKAILFLPQFVVVIAFPSMSQQGASRQDARPGAVGLAPASGSLGVARHAAAARPRPAVRRRRRVRRRSRTTCGCSRSSAPCSRCSSCSSTRSLARRQGRAVLIIWTALAVLVAIAVTLSTADRAGQGRRVRRRRAVPGAVRAGGQPAARPGPPTRRRRLTQASGSLVPARARPDDDVERHQQVGGRAHLLADQGVEGVPLPRRHLEDELVVDLEQHP